MIREVTEPLYAVRRWVASTSGLQSVTAHYVWPGPVVHAKYHPFQHFRALFAWNDRGVLIDPIFLEWCGRRAPERTVFGVVELQGDVAIHRFGYRASTAIVRHLFIREDLHFKTLIAPLEQYDCPVDTLPTDQFFTIYNSQLANRYRLGVLEEDIRTVSQWSPHFVWRTADGIIQSLGDLSDLHIRNICKYNPLRGSKTLLEKITLTEAGRRGISLTTPKKGAFSKFKPVEVESWRSGKSKKEST